MSAVRKVTLIVETSDGESHTHVVKDPSPQGGNPAFMGQQLQDALDTLTLRSHIVLASVHGPQRVQR